MVPALFFLGTLVLGGVQLAALQKEYAAGAAAYDALEAYARYDAPSAPPAPTLQSGEDPTAEPPAETPPPWPRVDFEALSAINPDVVGWLTIEGTGIEYPVVQAGDNKYYLKHIFTGERNRAGCIFLDCNNASDFSDPNSVVYGHQLNDGSMLSPILNYKRQDYFDAHPTGWLVTPRETYRVRFFSGFVSDVWGDAWTLAPDAAWPGKMAAKSLFSGGPSPGDGDRFLTLSTCSYEFTNARFVLLGVLCPVGGENVPAQTP